MFAHYLKVASDGLMHERHTYVVTLGSGNTARQVRTPRTYTGRQADRYDVCGGWPVASLSRSEGGRRMVWPVSLRVGADEGADRQGRPAAALADFLAAGLPARWPKSRSPPRCSSARWRPLPDLTIVITDDVKAAVSRAEVRDGTAYTPEQWRLCRRHPCGNSQNTKR